MFCHKMPFFLYTQIALNIAASLPEIPRLCAATADDYWFLKEQINTLNVLTSFFIVLILKLNAKHGPADKNPWCSTIHDLSIT